MRARRGSVYLGLPLSVLLELLLYRPDQDKKNEIRTWPVLRWRAAINNPGVGSAWSSSSRSDWLHKSPILPSTGGTIRKSQNSNLLLEFRFLVWSGES